jgi:hypothetical protein
MYQMLSLWYSITPGCFAFNINATSTPTPKNGIRVHSHAFGDIGVLAWGGERLAAGTRCTDCPLQLTTRMALNAPTA